MSRASQLVQHATWLHSIGLIPIAVAAGSKVAVRQGWQHTAHASAEAAAASLAEHEGNIAVTFPPNLVCIDADVKGGVDGHASLAALGPAPATLTARTPSGGSHLYFRLPTGATLRTAAGILPGVDIRSVGGYALVEPSVVEGKSYLWVRDAAGDVPAIAEMPTSWIAALSSNRPSPRLDEGVEWAALTPADQAKVLGELRSALTALDPDDHDTWVAVGHALRALGDVVGFALWSEWSATSKRFPGGDGLERWSSFTGQRTGYQAIFAHAQRAGWSNPAARPALPSDAAMVFAAPAAVAQQLPAMVMVRPGPPAELTFTAAAQGAIPATVERVIAALLSPEAGVVIARDDFFERILIDGRPLEDEDSTDLRARFERRGFKPVSADMMRDAIRFVARANRFDSAIDWARALAPWDGLKRIDTSMAVYYGAVDTPYTRAVGAYLFTALAGRCLVPGIKADMAPILIGLQGARKTSAVEALCPIPGAFGEIDLNKHDDALARLVRGKLVMELAELRGLSGRDSESTKAWLSRGVEEYRPVYRENLVKYPRRCVVIGTGNVSRILEDETGHRRYLPVHVGVVNLDALRRDRDQLWAEGLARFNAEGIAWQDAERLATAEHGAFEIVDEREALVAAWLTAPPPAIPGQPLNTTPRGAVPVRPIDVATEALNFTPAQFTGVAQKQIARIMRKLGYEPSKQRINGKPENVWLRTGT